MDTLANPETINSPWGTGYGPSAMARDSGQFFAGQYYQEEICRLNPSSGSIQATHGTSERNSYRHNGIDAVDGKVWYSGYDTPRNRIHCMDGTSGDLLTSREVSGWDESAYIYDVSFANSTQCWMLTYNVKGDSKRWAHLVDLSAGARFSRSTGNGSVSAGGTGTIDVSLNTTGLAIGLYPVALDFTSNDPDEPGYQKTIYFLVHEDAPNNPPVASAGPDQTREIPGVTAPFILDLTGAGSSDPDGDPLHMSWSYTDTGEPVVVSDKGLTELGDGVHRLTLTVHDYRGGTNTDEKVITVNANTPMSGWPQYGGPTRNHVSTETGWLENWPPIERWRLKAGFGYGHPVINDGCLYVHRSTDGMHQPQVRCYDLREAALLWASDDVIEGAADWDHGLMFGWVQATPAVDERYVYTYNNGAIAAAWDRYTGSNIWSTATYNLGNTSEHCGRGSSPLVEGDLVIVQRTALNKHTGELVWKTSSQSWHGWSWGLDWDNRRWFVYNGRMTDALTGEQDITLGSPLGRGSMGPVLYGDNAIYDVKGVRPIGAASDTWSNSDSTLMYTSPVIEGDYAYICHCSQYRSMHGDMRCIRLTDGQEMWVNRRTYGATVADGKLLSSTYYGGIEVAACGPSGYDLEGRAKVKIDGLNIGDYGAPPVMVDKRLYVQCRQHWIVCLDTAYSAPVVSNADGAEWDAVTGSAKLTGILMNTGGRPPTVSVYWGRSDGGTNAGAWEHCETLGPRDVGAFATAVAGLERNRQYFYRCFAANTEGGGWAAETEAFSTYAESTVDLSRGLLLHWPLDETSGGWAADVSGHGNHGECIGLSDSAWIDGTLGGGIALEGDPRVRCARLSQRLREQWTVSFWFNVSGEGQLARLSYDEREQGESSASPQTVTYNRKTIKVRGWDGTTSPDEGQWKHCVLTQNGDDRTVYYNGKRHYDWVEPEKTFRTIAFGGAAFKLDDVRVYRRALNAEEIYRLYSLGIAGGAWSAHESSVGGSADDAQEDAGGNVTLDGAVLELGEDAAGGATIVGLRFPGLAIPRGATIVRADVQFESAATDTNAARFSIRGWAQDNAAPFTAQSALLSTAPLTAAGVPWTVAPWEAGACGPPQKTPDLGAIVQELVDRAGWSNGQAVALLIIADTSLGQEGRRRAVSADASSGLAARLEVAWVDVRDLDRDGLPDCWERSAARRPAGECDIAGDEDNDGAANWREYFFGTAADDPGDKSALSLRTLPDGRVVAVIDGKAACGPGYEGLNRYYTLGRLDTLPGGTVDATQTVWVEDFSLPDGTTTDAGTTAWTVDGTAGGLLCVTNGSFWCEKTTGEVAWISEPIAVAWTKVSITADIASDGKALDSTDYIRVFYSLNGGMEQLIGERYDNFNGNNPVTLSVDGLLAESLQIIVRVRCDRIGERYRFDNVKVSRQTRAAWPAVPAVSNVLVETDRIIEYTNNTPAKTGFYRLKTKLE